MKIECPKCHQRYGINENYIGQEIECGCGERIRISLTAESATRPKCKASFFQIFVCVYLILILVCVCGGLGWGYSEIRRLNENLYGAQGKMTRGILGVLNGIEDEVTSLKSDVSELKGATNGNFADNLSEIREEQKRIDKNIQGLYDNQQLLFTWCKTQDERLWGAVPSTLTGNSLWGQVSDLKTQADRLGFMQINISSMESDISSMKRDIDELSTRLWGTLPPYGLEFSGGLLKKIEKIQDSIDTIQFRLSY